MSREPTLSYQEALEIVQTEDRYLRNLSAGLRFDEVVNVDEEVSLYSKLKVISLSLFGTLSLAPIVVIAPEVLSAYESFPVAGVFLTVALSSTGLHRFPKLSRLISPKKYKKLHDAHLLRERFIRMKMENFREVEAKSLKRTKKALNVINRTARVKGVEMVYTRDGELVGFNLMLLPENR